MRILRIDLMGQTESFAFLRRLTAGRYISVEIVLTQANEKGGREGYGRQACRVRADSRDGQWSMAKRL